MEGEDEDEDHLGNKDLFDGYLKTSGNYTSESLNGKRKVESTYGLFCVMRKRSCRHNDMFPDLDYAEKGDGNHLRPENLMENPNDEDIIVDEDDCCCSGSDSDADLSECSEFDVISQEVVQDEDSILLLSPDEVNQENGARPKEDVVLSSVSASRNDPQMSSSNDNLTLVNEEDDEPIPISSVPPDDGPSSVLLQTSPLHQHNVHDDKIGLGISPMPLTKTLQGPSRPWSVCGSLAAVRNIPPLLGDTPGACSSLDGLLYVDVGSSEGRDAQLSKTPSTLYQEEEVDGEDEISFSDVDAMIRKLNLIPDDSDSCLNREERNMSKHPRHTLLGSEHCTRTSVRRGIISQGAIAVLSCRDSKHFIRKHDVIIGRSSDGMNVDIDLGKDGYGSKIARRQALVKLEKNGSFSLKNLGKRHILVNGEKLNTGQIVSLTSCSSVDIRGIVFEFKINKEAVRQFLKNNSRRNSEDDNKFRWAVIEMKF